MDEARERFRRLCWASLLTALGVILWGAYVRASGSGAGCGSHWPLCNGEVVPRTPTAATVIELTHRVTSAGAGLLVLWQYVWARRLFPHGQPLRRAVAFAGVFMLSEVLIGAGIVLLKYVAKDQSVGRAVWMGLHLINTFLLVGALGLVVRYARGGGRWQWQGRGVVVFVGAAAVLATLATGASGAIAALGDTLFPPKTLGRALAEDVSPAAHWLVQLRVTHPFMAIGAAFVLLFARQVIEAVRSSRAVAAAGLQLRIAVVIQVALGFLNMLMLAPTWMQLVHLLMAQLLWLALVQFLATALEVDEAGEHEGAPVEPAATADEAPSSSTA